jgi:hypothetical protein
MTDKANLFRWNASVAYTEPLNRGFVLSLNYTMSGIQRDEVRLQRDFNLFTNAYDLLDTMFSSDFGAFFLRQNFLVQIQRTAQNYNYAFGLGLEPSTTVGRMEGLSDITHNAFSLAPQARFRYSFTARTRLNLTYNGSARQPSVRQLRRIPDIYQLDIQIGNSELKPEYTHRFNATFNSFTPKMHTINSSIAFNTTQNRIANITIHNPDLFSNIQLDSSIFRPGMRINMPDNVGTSYNAGGSLSYGIPLFSEKMYLNFAVRGNYRNSRNFVDRDVNIMDNLMLSGNPKITYRRERFDVGVEGSFIRDNSRFSLLPERNYTEYRNFVRTDFSLHIIPKKLTLSSDLQYLTQTGYRDFNNTSALWNAQLSYNIGQNNNAQLLFQVFDILNNRQEVGRNATGTYIEDVRFNTLRRFFMASFIYSKRQDGRS